MNQLLAIRAFGRVVETGSFTRAADSLDMPKTTVSKLVQSLEAHLGQALLLRTTRRLTVTAEGNAYYEQASRLVRELEDIDSSIAGAPARLRGKIRVDVGGTTARMLVIPALKGFYEQYPDLQLVLGVSDRPVDLISENVDCVIRGGVMAKTSDISRLLGTASWTTCAAPGYLRRHGVPKHPDDLRQGHWIVGYHSALTGRPIPSSFQRGGDRIRIDSPYKISVNDGAARIAAGLAGLGVLQTFTYAVQEPLKSGQLTPILKDWAPARFPFRVVYSPNRKLSSRARVFIEWLSRTFEKLP